MRHLSLPFFCVVGLLRALLERLIHTSTAKSVSPTAVGIINFNWTCQLPAQGNWPALFNQADWNSSISTTNNLIAPLLRLQINLLQRDVCHGLGKILEKFRVCH